MTLRFENLDSQEWCMGTNASNNKTEIHQGD